MAGTPRIRFDPATEWNGPPHLACCKTIPTLEQKDSRVRLVCDACGRGKGSKFCKNRRSADAQWRALDEPWDRTTKAMP